MIERGQQILMLAKSIQSTFSTSEWTRLAISLHLMSGLIVILVFSEVSGGGMMITRDMF